MFRLKPPEKSVVPKNKFRKAIYMFIISKFFEKLIMTVILLSVATMGVSYFDETEEFAAVSTC